jgi:hypothetical protein
MGLALAARPWFWRAADLLGADESLAEIHTL